MATNNIRVRLMFDSDTSKARASLKQLQTDLDNISNMATKGDFKLTDKVVEGQRAAAQLKGILNECVNIDTGQFDLSKFSSKLKKGGTDLKQLATNLQNLGPEGSKAFMSLAQSIVQAEIPTKRLNAKIEQFAKTLKDTARWQLSSSIMHGLTGALENAYYYAQDLNRSLNDIRIVTDYSEERMAGFAVEANKAAKALSTTTKEYAEASLIYFQQGLNDEEVAQRTATTIKLANVTGKSAEDVSSYMTAVWNNFDDGTKSLEYYADAIAALGAATASSSEEIATGLQKFSAVASTVGLSYEYATAALATVTAQTRESAETVGTAFKTIFARLESLSLGETLDDDTTLTKYSQALAKVGVNIKNANGDLKDMDTIIDELGQKWNNIDKDQQVALAQTVAGMRQYNNFIALMDNYDTFTANVEIAVSSEGDLSKQAEIYAESWEAAKDRVTAAAETLYDKLLDDKTFIKLTDTFAKLLELLDQFIDSAGGLKGIMAMLAAVLTRIFNSQIANGLEDMVYNFKSFFGIAKKEAKSIKQQVSDIVDSMIPAGGEITEVYQAEINMLKQKVALQAEYAQLEGKLNDKQKEEFKIKMALFESSQQRHINLVKEKEKVENKRADLGFELKRKATQQGIIFERTEEMFGEDQKEAKRQLQAFNDLIKNLADTAGRGTGNLTQFTQNMQLLIEEAKDGTNGEENPLSRYMENILQETQDALGRPNYSTTQKFLEWQKKYSEINDEGTSQEQKQQNLLIDTYASSIMADTLDTTIDKIYDFHDAGKELDGIQQQVAESAENVSKSEEEVEKIMKKGKKSGMDYYKMFTDLVSATTSLISAFSAFETIWDTLQDPELSSWEKITSIMMSLLTIVPMVITALVSFKETELAVIAVEKIKNVVEATGLGLQTMRAAVTAAKIIANTAELQSIKDLSNEEAARQIQEKYGIGLKLANIAVIIAKSAAEAKETGQTFTSILAHKLEEAAITGGTGAKVLATIATWLLTAAETAACPPMLIFVAAVLALTAALAGLVAGIVVAIAAFAGLVVIIVNVFEAIKNASPEECLKGTNEQLRAFQDNAKKAREENDKLIESINNYDSAVEKMKTLAKGTEAYREEVRKANEAARELISQYEDLKYNFNATTGLIEIHFEDLERIQNEQATKLSRAEIDVLMSENAVEKYTTLVNQRDTAGDLANKDWFDGLSGWDILAGISTGTKIGAGIGANVGTTVWSTIPGGALMTLPSNIVAGAGIGAVVGGVGSIAGQNIDQAKGLEKLFEEYDKYDGNYDKAFNSLTAAQQRLIEGLDLTKGELMKLCEETRINTQAITENSKQIAASLMIGNKSYDISYAQNTATAIAAQQIRDETDALYESEYKDKIGGITDAEIQEEYAKAMGWDPKLVKNKNGNTAIYVNSDGEEIQISDSVARMYLAEKAAQDNVDTEAVVKEAEAKVRRVRSVATNISWEQADKITADLISGKTADLSSLTYGQIQQIQNSNDTSEEGKALIESAKEAQKVWDEAVDLFSSHTREIVEQLGTNTAYTISQANLLAYGKTIENIKDSFGEDMGQSYASMMDELLAENAEAADSIVAISNSIDWSNGEQGLRDFQAELSTIGIYINETDQKWAAFTEELAAANLSVLKYDLQEIRQQLSDLSKLVENIEFGSIISDEDYQKLIKYNGELAKMFQITVDGYQYIGEDPLTNHVEGFANDMLQNTLTANKQGRSAANKFRSDDFKQNYDYNTLNANGETALALGLKQLLNNEEYGEAIAATGWDKTRLMGYANTLLSLFAKRSDKDYAADQIQKFYDEINKILSKDSVGQFDDHQAYSVYASRFTSRAELEDKREEFEDAGQIRAYNDRMLYLERQAKQLLTEYSKEIDQLELDSLSERFDDLIDLSGKTTEAIDLLERQRVIYSKNINAIGNDLNKIAEDYGIAIQQPGESISAFMERIITEAPLASEEVLKLGENIKTAIDNLKSLDEALAESLFDYFEDTSEAWDKWTEKYERAVSQVGHARNVLGLIGANAGNELMIGLGDAEADGAIAQFNVAQKKYNDLFAKRQEAEKALQTAIDNGDEVSQAKWKEQLDAIVELEYEALEEMNESWTDALGQAAETLANNTEQIMSSFEKSMSGLFGTFDRMSEVFDQQSQLNTQYVADYKKVYELSKLTRNIQNQIDNVDNVAAKKSLREIQEEVNSLQASSVQMSEYDLEFLQKKYNLRVAEIALEEAQNAKSQVRLQKMADGSWGYVYTQNAEMVESAQQNYEDSMYELQELSSSYLDETSSNIIAIQSEFNDAINEIMSSGLSNDEKREQIEETVKFYEERLAFLTSEFDNVIANNQGMANLVQNFSDTLLAAMYPTGEYENATSIFETWRNGLGEMDAGTGILGELGNELTKYSQKVNQVLNIAGVQSIEEYMNMVNAKLNGDPESGEVGLKQMFANGIQGIEDWLPEDLKLEGMEALLGQIQDYKEKINIELNQLLEDYKKFLEFEYIYEENTTDPNGEGRSMPPQLRNSYIDRIVADRFDTGGYTGSWGPSGKLAVLHEKELVLNKQDTPNILAAVDAVRQISQRIDLQAAFASSRGSFARSPYVNNADNNLQQEVNIHAEFPNATNHSEIEQAFDTLINRAAQFTNRNR